MSTRTGISNNNSIIPRHYSPTIYEELEKTAEIPDFLVKNEPFN